MADAALLKLWGLEFVRERKEIPVSGSPERTLSRVVAEDKTGALFIVESVAAGQVARKQDIALIMEHLHGNGLDTVHPYCRSLQGDFLQAGAGGFYQVVPYVRGVPLLRPDYVHDAWRGDAAAVFLLRMKEAAPKLNGPVFALLNYIDKLMISIRLNRPDMAVRLEGFYSYVLQKLAVVYDQLPSCFAHGDYHMLNIIWHEHDIAAVIDWEFCGRKPELYDAANMVSCLGVEDPRALWEGAAVPFMRSLRASGRFQAVSFQYFIPLVIALRFAWVSEWLRKKDDAMLSLELDYFDILRAREQDLSVLWGVS